MKLPENSRAGGLPPASGPGPDAAAIPPAQAAAARDAVSPAPGNGIPGTLQGPANGAAHPVAPFAASPAPGSSPFPAADGGPAGPPARALAVVVGCGGQGAPSRNVGSREGDAGPGAADPGPAQSSPLAPEGRASRDGEAGPAGPSSPAGPARAPAPGADGLGASGAGTGPAGSGRTGEALPAGSTPGAAERLRPAAAASGPEPKSGQEGRDAWRKALSEQAAAKRRARGNWTPRSTAGAYRPGMTRRAPE
jgi:hypothetical protein